MSLIRCIQSTMPQIKLGQVSPEQVAGAVHKNCPVHLKPYGEEDEQPVEEVDLPFLHIDPRKT